MPRRYLISWEERLPLSTRKKDWTPYQTVHRLLRHPDGSLVIFDTREEALAELEEIHGAWPDAVVTDFHSSTPSPS